MEEKLRNMEDIVYEKSVWNAKKKRKRGNKEETISEDKITENFSESISYRIYISKPN